MHLYKKHLFVLHAPWTLQRFWCSAPKKLAIFLSFFDAHVCLMQMAVIHFHMKNIKIMLISFYLCLNFVVLRIDGILVLIWFIIYLNSYFNVKLNTSIQNMYICCTAAATQIYSNVGGNLRQQAFCCSMCTSDAIYRDSRPWKKWAHTIKVY